MEPKGGERVEGWRGGERAEGRREGGGEEGRREGGGKEGRTGKTDIIQYNLNYYLYAKHVSMCYLYPLLS